MLPVIVAMLLMDLARPLGVDENREVLARPPLTHSLLPPLPSRTTGRRGEPWRASSVPG
jgi:hypothetical protein